MSSNVPIYRSLDRLKHHPEKRVALTAKVSLSAFIDLELELEEAKALLKSNQRAFQKNLSRFNYKDEVVMYDAYKAIDAYLLRNP